MVVMTSADWDAFALLGTTLVVGSLLGWFTAWIDRKINSLWLAAIVYLLFIAVWGFALVMLLGGGGGQT